MNTISLENVNRQTFEAMLNKINDAGEANVTGSIDGQTASLTIVRANGTKTSIEILLPDLDKPEANGDGVDWKAFGGKIEKMLDDNRNGTPARQVSTGVFVDLYAVFSLLLQVAQKLRESGAKMNAAAHQQLQASFTQQASTIRANAKTAYSQARMGAITSAVMTSVSGAMTIGSLGLEARAAFKSNLGTTGKNLDNVQNQIDSVKNIKPEENVTFTPEEQQMLFGEGDSKNLTLTEKDLFDKLDQQGYNQGRNDFDAANVKDFGMNPDGLDGVEDLKDLESGCQPVRKPVVSEETAKARTEFEEASANVKSQEKLVEKAKLEQVAAKEAYDKNPDSPELAQKYEAANKRVDVCEAELGKAKTACADKAVAYRESMKKDLGAFLKDKGVGAFGKALDSVTHGTKGVVPVGKALSAEKQTALSLARKLQASVDGKVSSPIVEGLTTKLDQMKGLHARELKLVLNSGKMRVANAFEHVGSVSKQVGDTVNAFAHADSEKTQTEAQALDKIKQAEQEGIRAQIDRIKEMRDQEGDLLRTIQETVKEITRAEHDSLSAAINV